MNEIEALPSTAEPRECHLDDCLSLYQADPLDLAHLIKSGVEAVAVIELLSRLEVSEKVWQGLGLSKRVVRRKAKLGVRISTAQSERVVAVARLVGQVEHMVIESGDPRGFDPEKWTGRWLERPSHALGGRVPADYLDTLEGQGLLSKLLGRQQSGAYS